MNAREPMCMVSLLIGILSTFVSHLGESVAVDRVASLRI